jgi:hypothetical protein
VTGIDCSENYIGKNLVGGLGECLKTVGYRRLALGSVDTSY